MSIKITPDYRDRQAYVYVRQSTADQLLHNHEEAVSKRPSATA